MQRNHSSSITATTLPLWRVSTVIWATALLALAVVLPSLAHLTGLPVRTLLPMHWPVILAGLVYGWRGGMMVGALSPVVSFAFSGMPFPPMILPMSVELAAYGAVTGFCRESLRLNGFVSVLVGLLVGRVVFVATVVIAGSVSQPLAAYLQAAMLPGIIAALAQMVTLPFIARWWVKSMAPRA